MRLTYYAIKHRPTGHYLPGSVRGAMRPADAVPTPVAMRAPRLWDNESNAHNALTHYLKIKGGSREEFCVAEVDVRVP
jgi:hypothetical protein